VIRQRVPVRALTRETGGAPDGLGGKGGRAIQGHQELLAAAPDTLDKVVLCKALKDRKKDRVAMARGDRSEAGAKNEGAWVKKRPKAPQAASGRRYGVLRP